MKYLLLSICLWNRTLQLKICLTLWIGKVKLLNNSEIDTKFLQLLQSTACDIHEWCYYISTTFTGWKITNNDKKVSCLKVYFLVMSASKKSIQIFPFIGRHSNVDNLFARRHNLKKAFKQGTSLMQIPESILWGKNLLFTYILSDSDHLFEKKKNQFF